jgi:C4-dicarboxylate-specific signal transduction histidine kinase
MTVMNNVKLTGVLVAAMAFAVSSPAWSHHSHAMFDHDKEVTIAGTVAEWVFRNPHVFLYVDARTDKGDTVRYTVEMSNITNMLKVGFATTTFKAGDKVTVTMHPLVDGRPGGNYIVATSADGKQFGRM